MRAPLSFGMSPWNITPYSVRIASQPRDGTSSDHELPKANKQNRVPLPLQTDTLSLPHILTNRHPPRPSLPWTSLADVETLALEARNTPYNRSP